MRTLLGLLLLIAPTLVLLACETRPVTNSPTPAASQPGPLDRISDPMNQNRFDTRGRLRP